jgi:peroxiredoxin
MKKIAESYKDRGVVVLAVAPNRNETKAQIKRYAEDQKLNFPVLIDEGNSIADLFDAKATPQIFVLDSQRKVRYIGAVDNGKDIGEEDREAYLENALNAILAGKEPPKAQTNAFGCMIKRDRG